MTSPSSTRRRPASPTSALLVAWLVACAACGRVSFERREGADAAIVVDAAPCVGDLRVDTAADDAAQACQGAGCSLRGALAVARTRPGATICIQDGVAVTLATHVAISSDVTIDGDGAIITGAGADRLFRVLAGGTLRLRALKLRGGRLVDASGAAVLVDDGGALDADGVAFVDHVVTSDAVFTEGGAVRADGDVTIELRRSRFSDNRAVQLSTVTGYARGGAFAIRAGANARVVIEDTAFEDNFATNVGGALFLAIEGADLTAERVLYARNTSDRGAAIDVNCASTGQLQLRSSTFADNVSSGLHSTIYLCGMQTVHFEHCSFLGNAGPLVGLETGTSRVEWRGCAIHAGSYALCIGAGTGMSYGFNVADHDDAICRLPTTNDQLVDPLLAPLADHGGPTETLALVSGSPAIDAAGPSCPAFDQRGAARPAGAACDAGAYEAP